MIESVNDENDYNNLSSCLVGKKKEISRLILIIFKMIILFILFYLEVDERLKWR